MFTFGLAGGREGLDPLILLLIALALEAVVGDAHFLFKRVPHPARLISAFVAFLERKLNRAHRGQRDRAVRGLLVAVVLVAACILAGWGAAWLTQNFAFGWVVELSLLAAFIRQRGFHGQARAVSAALAEGDALAARDAVSVLGGSALSGADAHEIVRRAVEAAAWNYCARSVAPVLWYVLFGLPGFLVYIGVNLGARELGQPLPRYRAFGMALTRLDDVLNLIPARLAGLFVVFAALFVPGARPAAGLKVMLRDAGRRASPNAGWGEGAFAGALDLVLGGSRGGDGESKGLWIGQGRAQATVQDLRRGLYLFAVACLINAMWVGAIAMVRFSLPG